MIKKVFVFSSMLSLAASFWLFSAQAIEIPDRSFSEDSANPQDFPEKGFSFAQCSTKIPVAKNQNPWLRIDRRRVKSGAWVESYFISTMDKSHAFFIRNQEDSVYSSPTTLAKIDCKNGLIYFQLFVREPVPTNYFRVFDLVSGEEHKVIEGAVTVSPDGKHLLTTSASANDVKCGHHSTCHLTMRFYNCKNRKKGEACTLRKSFVYDVTAPTGKRVNFAALPVKWKERLKGRDLKVTIGGSSRSPAKVTCEVGTRLQCKATGSKAASFREKKEGSP